MEKKKRIVFILLIFLIIITTIFIYAYKSGTLKNINSRTLGYPSKSTKVIKENNTPDVIEEYSKTIKNLKLYNEYKEEYLNSYKDIDYSETENFITSINTLLDKGYTSSDINNLYKLLSKENIDTILKYDKINIINDLITNNFFKSINLERYINYLLLNIELNANDIIINVNCNIDYPFYTNTSEITNPDDLLVLVNKYFYLPSTYIPSDLEQISTTYSVQNQYLKKDAKNSFETMANDAKLENIYIYAGSSYRSYNRQNELFTYYSKVDGVTEAETYSARPGYSEHQTGLAVDILNGSFNYISKDTIEYSWLINNSYKYGYILRYPEEKGFITGYKFEEWHYRYIGTEEAKKVFDSKLTYDEYITMYK